MTWSTTMWLRPDATAYTVRHELAHYLHWRSLGKDFDAYFNVEGGRLVREQFVYDALRNNRNWDSLTQFERDHAKWYIRSLGGNARAANLKDMVPR